MRTQAAKLLFAPVIFLLVSCGGGSGGPAAQVVPQTIPGGPLSLSGRITVADFIAADNDTNNPESGPLLINNSAGTAQRIPNPGTVGGYVNEPGAGAAGAAQVIGDRHDFYRVNLLQGQTVRLSISDFIGANPTQNDIDLLLVDLGLVLVDFSAGFGSTEQLSAPADGEYIVVVTSCATPLFVDPVDICTRGPTASNYVLNIGQGGGATTVTSMRLSDDFVAGEAIANMRPPAEPEAPADGVAEQLRVAPSVVPGKAGAHGGGVQLLRFDMPPLRVAASAAQEDTAGKITMSASQLAKAHTLARIKTLIHSEQAEWAEPNFIRRTVYEPDDPGYQFQWHYPQINLPAAWDETLGDPNVTVAVIDTGVLGGHPDLSGQLVPGYDFVASIADAGDGDGDDPDPEDPGDGGFGFSSSFHGTHVAGTVAASGNNGLGVSGVAPDVKVMPIRALGVNGSGTSFDVRRSMCYAAGLSGTTYCPVLPVNPSPVDIINLSLGGGGFSAAGQGVVNEVRGAGVTVVAAAGNESSSAAFYPAAYNGVMAVSAVTITGAPAFYSNFGAYVDVAAPGGSTGSDLNGDGYADGVLSTGGNDAQVTVDYNYTFKQGTSMAAPHVAGVLALMKSVNSSLGPAQFDQLLVAGGMTNTTQPGVHNAALGYGLINAQKSVVAALAAPGGGTPPAPAPWLGVTPLSLNFGATLTSVNFDLRNNAGGELNILSIAAAPDNPADPDWLVEPAADGLGSYSLLVDRAGLADGNYAGTLTVVSDVNTVQVPVIMQVSSAPLSGDAGPLTVRLLDEESGLFRDVTATAANGAYEWQINAVPEGEYRLFAFTDADNDGQICDAGEACGVYITDDQPLLIDLQQSETGLDFPVSYDSEVSGQ